MSDVISHWLDGKPFTGTSDNTAPVTNPATGAVTGQVALAGVEDARAVIDAAAAAFPAWRDTSLAKRTQVIFTFRELLNARKGELAEIITAEHGKVVSDALGEVSRGQEVVEFACGIAHLLKGGMTENASTNIDVSSLRQPVGPVGIISPFNFPAMVPMWFFPIAIAAGNTVVLKPSEKDPTAAIWMAELWAEAGLPAGVFNVLQGDKTAVDELLTHPAIKAISFVGSTPIAQYVYATGTAHGKRVQALGGAKNHAIVLPDADLDLAADAMVNAGFGSAGERCMAISALVAVGDIADELVTKIKERTDTLKIGDGTRDSDMGPLVTKVHRDKVASYIDAGENDGATIVVDGRTVQADGGKDGFWLGPTLIDHVTTDMSVYTDEIFGPILSVIRVDSYDAVSLGPGRGRRHRRRTRDQDQRAHRHIEDRRRHPRLRHRTAGDQGAPRQGRLLHRRRRKRRGHHRRRRPHRARKWRCGRVLARPDPDRPRHHRHECVHRRNLRTRPLRDPRRLLRRGPGIGELQPVRQRHRHLHQRRRRRPAVPERGRGRDGRHQRPHPRPHGLLLLRWLEELPLRRHSRPRHRRRPLLHPRQGRHHPLARPQPRRPQPRIPPEQLTDDARVGRTPGPGRPLARPQDLALVPL
ncbi:Methylmalonate semialdehyde dehydrogenase [acylating] 2 [Rhodococcus opacus PD630]|nr:Methylmalonate semialdehyde dehydrogenase [acylating] 2 [Rhodococcus opacus PD630]